MTYFYHGNKSESSKAFINNKFNSKSIKYLEEGDTLVVQQFTLMLTKIK
jgi:antitoxin component YwqK of YwqJK toxin-antitoxin module